MILLLVVVAVPTIGILWFAAIAIDNQRLATKQQLSDAYRSHLKILQQEIDSDWQAFLAEVDRLSELPTPESRFAAGLHFEDLASVIVYDEGRLAYPASRRAPQGIINRDPRWDRAEQLEESPASISQALSLYEKIEGDASQAAERAMALQAQVRCLFKTAGQDEAIQRAFAALLEKPFQPPLDPLARSVIANLELMTIENLEPGPPRDEILNRLLERVDRYDDQSLSPSQRLFMLKQIEELAPNRVDRRTLRAENLAAQYADKHPSTTLPNGIQRAPFPDLWQATTASRNFVVLLPTEQIHSKTQAATTRIGLPTGVTVKLLTPADATPQRDFLSVAAGPVLPGWRLSLAPKDAAQIDSTAIQKNRVYLWTGSLAALFTSILGIMIVRAFRRQLRLANLKNDLVGTVSHELKTPLSSMRLLVETLLSEDQFPADKTRQYLQLIAKENTRLSRLIENFLTFTRMDQGRYGFDFEELDPAAVAAEAVASVQERFRAPQCEFQTTIADDLPRIAGDQDALVTALLNLLDNAFKYSNEPRSISLTVHARREHVLFDVHDNGVGLPRSATKRIFQRFYQVDQSLTRHGHGCGLGLSIVEHIVRAHDGAVSVESTLGEGSTFTISLPKARDPGEVHA